jgi:transposase
LPHAIEVTIANVNGRKAAVLTLRLNADTLSDVARIQVDGGCTGEQFAHRVEMILGADVAIARRSQLPRFAVIPRRWIVERSFARLGK